MKTCITTSLFALLAGLTSAAMAADAALGAEAAKGMPLADMHFHVMPFMSDRDLGKHMADNGVRWAGGAGVVGQVGPDGPPRLAEVVAAFGKRFITYTGQHQWIRLKRSGGTAALENADSPAFQQGLAQMEKDLQNGARVVGEIHINTLQSAPNDLLRHKVRADAPTLRAMFELVGKYKRPMNVHAQWDSDTAEQLGTLADSNPGALLILSHCGSNAGAADVRAFFEKHPNTLCDLSFRSAAQVPPHVAERAAYAANSLREEWKQLIETYPDRFMVGIDDVHTWEQYDAVAQNIRGGLLANLSPATAEKVAYKNAVRLFGLN